jgi:hypothetical protein
MEKALAPQHFLSSLASFLGNEIVCARHVIPRFIGLQLANMPEDKEEQLAAYDKIMELAAIPVADRPKYRAGAEQLMDLGWPTNYIDFGMIDRYYRGLVPRYEGYQSFTAYRLLVQEEEAAQAKARRNSSPFVAE